MPVGSTQFRGSRTSDEEDGRFKRLGKKAGPIVRPQSTSLWARGISLSTSLLGLALFCGLFSSPVYAQGFTIANGQTETTTQSLTDVETGIVVQGGSVIIPVGTGMAINATGDISIQNDGVITSGATATLDAANNGIVTTGNIINFVNSGTITAGNIGINATGNIVVFSNTGTIDTARSGVNSDGTITRLTNTGTISGTIEDGVRAQTDITHIDNSGTITGDDDGVQAFTGNITHFRNSGIVSSTTGNGIFAGTELVYFLNTQTGIVRSGSTTFDDAIQANSDIGTLINNGLIEGRDNGVLSGGAIVHLTNTGTLSGTTENGISADGGEITHLTNSGTISSTTGNGIFARTELVYFLNTQTGIVRSGTSALDDGVQANSIGTLINKGVIEAQENSVLASNGDITHLQNAGTISSAVANGIFADAELVYFLNTETGIVRSGNTTDDDGVHADSIGTIINNGLIEGQEKGVFADVGDITHLTNTGTISGATDDGVRAQTDITRMNNSGTITGNENGVLAFSGAITHLTNSGTISSTSGNGIFAGTELVYFLNTETGIVRSGNTTFDDGVQANSIGILINKGVIEAQENSVLASNGDITHLQNAGTISSAVANGIFADAKLVYFLNTETGVVRSGNTTDDDGVQADSIGTIINNGVIEGQEKGVFADVGDITHLTNTGTISGATDDGVRAQTDIAHLDNSGTIAGENNGILALTGDITHLTNSGTISSAALDAIRLENGSLGVLINSGTLSANHGRNAIVSEGTNDTLLELRPGSQIFGNIDLSGGTNTLRIGRGLSVDLEFLATAGANFDPQIGVANLPGIIETSGMPFIVTGTRVIVFDTTMFAEEQDLLTDLSRGISETVFNHLRVGRIKVGLGTEMQTTAPTQFWSNGFGNHSVKDTGGGGIRVAQTTGGTIFGVDQPLDENALFGGFLGLAKQGTSSSLDQQKTTVDSYFGGVYASMNAGILNIDFALSGGMMAHDTERSIDNNRSTTPEQAKSNFYGGFITPEVAVNTIFTTDQFALRPSARFGYTGMFTKGATETGANANLTFGDRDLHQLFGRVELAALIDVEAADDVGFQYSPYVGGEIRGTVGNNTIDASALGQSFNFDPTTEQNLATAFAGLRVSASKNDIYNFSASFEASIDSNSSATFSSNIGMNWKF